MNDVSIGEMILIALISFVCGVGSGYTTWGTDNTKDKAAKLGLAEWKLDPETGEVEWDWRPMEKRFDTIVVFTEGR